MKRAYVYCNEMQNMGDVLIRDVINKVFECTDVHYTRSAKLANLYGIGSGLKMFEYKDNLFKKIYQYGCGRLFPSLTVWGAGFMNYDDDAPFYIKNIRFAALRGELTKKRVEDIIGMELQVPTADPGLLASYLLKENVDRKYDVGIVAHFREQDETVFSQMTGYYQNAYFIDIKAEPEKVIREIASCKCIISSSLHGLIVADSLGIPNIHLTVSDRLMGDGYKFDDYYSAFNVRHAKIDAASGFPSLDWIMSNYSINHSVVRDKQKQLVESFPLKCGNDLICK